MSTTAIADAPPESVHLRIIVVASRDHAEHVLESIQGGADFADLARKESIDPTAQVGGDLGLVHPDSLRAEMRAAVQALRPEQSSPVIAVPNGYAILKIADEHDAKAAPRSDSEVAGGVQFGGVRYPPATGGAVEVEGLFRQIDKPRGWNTDLHSFCEVHNLTLQVATDQLRTLLESDDLERDARMAPSDQMQAYYMWAVIEAYQGHMARAVELWERAYKIAVAGVPESVAMLQEVLGTVYLHKAEMDNGLYTHADERCIFPPRPGTPYPPFAKTADSRKAIQYLTQYLEKKPDDPGVRWLLNLAYLTLGEYPDGVPSRHRLPPALFRSKDDVGRFTDVAEPSGLTGKPFASGSMLVDDVDGDGLLDIVTSSYDVCEHIYYFHNEGDGTFSDRSEASGLSNVPGGQGIAQADYDNDGCLDMVVLRGAWQVPIPLSLLHNNCDGTFTDVTKEAGLRDALYQTQTAAWIDIDNDGRLDLFVGNEAGPSQLFRNKGGGTFENVSHAAGVDQTSFVKGVVVEDYDNDGYADIFVSNIRGGGNRLYHNNHDGTFTDVARQAGVEVSTASFTTWFFDYDNDGWPDLFVASDYASIDETMRTYLGQPRNTPPSKLYRNLGNGTFSDVAVAAGLDNGFMPMGATFGDLDNDGYLDIYLGTGAPDYGSLAPKVLLRNEGGKRFVDVTDLSGTGELHKMHGTAFADMENRGQQDIVASVGGAVPGDAHTLRLFRNPGHANAWINVRLVGTRTNRAALGAHIKVTVENKGVARSIYRTVGNGSSFGSSPLAQAIGLGPSARVTSLEVTWPVSKTRQTFKDVPVDSFIEIREGAASYKRVQARSYRPAARSTGTVPLAPVSVTTKKP